MKPRLFLLVALASTALTSRAQQILCERALMTTLTGTRGAVFNFANLLQPQPDSLRLVSDWYAFNALAFRTSVQPLDLSSCDTLSAGPAVYRAPATEKGDSFTPACTNHQGQVLLAQQSNVVAGRASTRLALFERNGQLRWQRQLPTLSFFEGAGSLIEAPGGGYFAIGGQTVNNVSRLVLWRLDSLGRVQWRRTPAVILGSGRCNPAYTRRGTLLVAVTHFPNQTANVPDFGLLELSQRGDSLTTHPIVIDPLQRTQTTWYITGSLQPLRDGGFAVVGEVDSASTGRFRPFLARLDANLNVAWFYVHRQQAALGHRFAHPYELADGSLAVLDSDGRSGRNEPFWLFRFAPAGALRNRYAFVPQVLPPTTSLGNGFVGYLGLLQGLQPLSDSTFVLASSLSVITTSGTSTSGYLAHLRVPGLPRVINSHYLPAALAARSGATLAPEALGPPHPNPATESVAFAYTLPGGTRAARLVLTNLLGRTVADVALERATGRATLPVQGLAAGLYIATLCAGGQLLASRKLAVAH